MKLMAILLVLYITLFAENNQTKEMSKEDVDAWFKEYRAIVEEGNKIKAEGKKLDKLNNTLDELNGMLGIDK